MFNKLFSKETPKIEAPPIHKKVKRNQDNQEEVKKRIQNNLSGSKFRLLNELLYVNNSQKAVEHFKENPEDFSTVIFLT